MSLLFGYASDLELVEQNVDMDGNRIFDHPDPTENSEPVTKGYAGQTLFGRWFRCNGSARTAGDRRVIRVTLAAKVRKDRKAHKGRRVIRVMLDREVRRARKVHKVPRDQQTARECVVLWSARFARPSGFNGTKGERWETLVVRSHRVHKVCEGRKVRRG